MYNGRNGTVSMSYDSKVSIVMPVYNVESYIRDSVKSVLRQTYKNIELIIVDDGSLDNSILYAEQILSASDFSYRIVKQKNAGQGEARNTGMHYSSGKWIYFLDSDDIIADNAIERLVEVGEKQKVDLVFSRYKEIHCLEDVERRCKKSVLKIFNAEELQLEFLQRNHVILAPGTLYKKEILEINGLFYEKIPWSEDQQFVWRVLYYIHTAGFVEEFLYYYLRHGGSIMSSTKVTAMIESYPAICELTKYYEKNKIIGKYIVARWVMGTLNSATIMVKFNEWKELAKNIEFKKNFLTLLKFPDLKVRVFALLGLSSPSLYYFINKKRKSRGNK